eukprot:gene23591-28573_t
MSPVNRAQNEYDNMGFRCLLHMKCQRCSSRSWDFACSIQVKVLDKANFGAYLCIQRPSGYTELRSYPVIYAFDGQNLMNPSTSFRGMDWQLGAVTSALINKGAIVPPIIVLLNNIGWPFRYFEYGDTDMGRDHLGNTPAPEFGQHA